MINPDNFLVLFHFTNSEHENLFSERLKLSCPRHCPLKPGAFVVHTKLKMPELYDQLNQGTDEEEYIFIFPISHHFYPPDSALQAFLFGWTDSC